jgi:hypothetical protein
VHRLGFSIAVHLVGLAIVQAQTPAAASAITPTADWPPRLHPTMPGDVQLPPSFQGVFRFGWSGVEAGRATASVGMEGPTVHVRVTGGTTGLARSLWKLDAVHESRFEVAGLRPLGFEQTERYSRRSIHTSATFFDGGAKRLRHVQPGPAARWKTIRLEPLRDVVAAMFFIRSQPLRKGETVTLLAFPGDSPYLVAVQACGRETLAFADVRREALRLDFRLQKVLMRKDELPLLEPHGKFRRGSVWLSDDALRIPLRAEVEVFVGKIFGELVSLRLDGAGGSGIEEIGEKAMMAQPQERAVP